MHEIEIIVSLQVDHDEVDGKLTEQEAQYAGLQAVANALKQVEGMGFSHDLADVASVGVAGVETWAARKSDLLTDVANDFETEGCEGMGTVSIATMNKIRKALGWELLPE